VRSPKSPRHAILAIYFTDKGLSREITKQLRKRFPQEDQEATENYRNSKGGMSLLEKMSIWQEKDGDEPLNPDETDHFEGVEDFEDVEEPSFGSQSKAIIGTKAYD
jgi:hypothetical protein